MARLRARSFPSTVNGSCIVRNPSGSSTSYSNSGVVGLYESCDDETGRDADHGLRIAREVSHPTALSGQYVNPANGRSYTFSNWRCEGFGTRGSHAGSLALPPLDLNALRLKLLSGSNPSRAEADLAVSIGELRNAPKAVFTGVRDYLKEIRHHPSILSHARSGLLRLRRNPISNGASGYLGLMFGLIPLVNDVKAIMNSQELIANRLRELQNLRDGDGMRRKMRLGRTQVKGPATTITVSSITGLIIDAKRTQYATRNIWGSVRWMPDGSHRIPDTDARRVMEARRAVYGLNIDLVSAYNLMPWSWLIDYFSSVGDFIETTRNVVGATPGNTNIMVHTIRAANITPISLPPGLSGGSCLDVRETKERFVGSGFTGLNSTVPILSGRQVSILGALAISRSPHKRR